jgi:putative ABC transport system permease protein
MPARVSERIYRLLLHCYPHDFRVEYQPEMIALFRRRMRDENAAVLWPETVADLVCTSLKEHLRMLFQDLKYALRMLRRAPVFSAAAVLTLALGVGANTAIFSVVNAVMLQPLPFPESGRLVRVWETNLKRNIQSFSASVPNFVSWKEQARCFEEIGAFGGASLNLTGDGEPERLLAGAITANVIPLLRIKPMLGRAFLPEEEQPNGARVAILSERLWRRRFAADPAIVGRSIELNGTLRQVVGIAPPALQFPTNAEIWVPMRIDLARENRGNHVISVIGRLRDRVTLAQADSQLKAIAAAMEQTYPGSNVGWSVRMAPFYEWIVPERIRTALTVLFGAVSLVLLTACVNVANLLLARAVSRSRETAVRLAMGASRRRIARHLLTESSVLAVLGGIAGALLAYWAVAGLKQLLADSIPRGTEIHVDAPVLAFALGISIVTGLLFGIAPLHQTADANLNHALKEGGRTSTATRQWMRQALVVAEIAMATMLAIGASLLAQSFGRLQGAQLGFQPERLLTAQISLPPAKYPPAAAATFYERLLEQLRHAPGVSDAAISSGVPMGAGDYTGMAARSPRSTDSSAAEMTQADWRMVSADYFKTMRIPLLRGRFFGPEDQGEKASSIVISGLLARRLYGDENVVGRDFEREIKEHFTIVGVVGDVRMNSLNQEPSPAMYFPAPRGLWPNMTVVVRTQGDPLHAEALLRSKVRELDARQPIYNVRSMENWIARDGSQARTNALLLTIFALVALALAAVGVYGVLSYSVTQRTSDLGIRIALGARAWDVMRLVLREGMLLALVGLAAGALGALAMRRTIETILFGVHADDPGTFVTVMFTLAIVSLLACTVPAWRAGRIDPLLALRQE